MSEDNSSTISDDELATPPEAARFLRTTVAKLAQDRYRGLGPKYIKDRGRILYEWAELRKYVKDNSITPRWQPQG
jgi:hypothetical protein